MALVVKNLPANTGDIARNAGSIPATLYFLLNFAVILKLL